MGDSLKMPARSMRCRLDKVYDTLPVSTIGSRHGRPISEKMRAASGGARLRIHTEVVEGPLALRMRRLDAARERATGRQILTIPLLAARLAGGFIAPATQEVLYPAIRQALEAGGYEDIDKVCQLPGMPAAVLSALRDWWDAEVPASLPDNARLRDFTLLERRVRRVRVRAPVRRPMRRPCRRLR
jgi:hypothetical protein